VEVDFSLILNFELRGLTAFWTHFKLQQIIMDVLSSQISFKNEVFKTLIAQSLSSEVN
jgi:hypothetical protein